MRDGRQAILQELLDHEEAANVGIIESWVSGLRPGLPGEQYLVEVDAGKLCAWTPRPNR